MGSESAWRSWLDAQQLPAIPTVSGRIVVLSAHPDDEVLGVGGWLADMAGHDIVFCTATDGEASHPGSPTYSPDDLAEIRAEELRAALKELGHDEPRIVRFGLADTGLPLDKERLTRCVSDVTEGADLVLSPSHVDGHGDHDALGRAAIEACKGKVPVWEYPIWAWEWTDPGEERVPWSRAAVHVLGAGARERKRAAIARFTTQVTALSDDPADRVMLEPRMLAHVDRPFEVVLR